MVDEVVHGEIRGLRLHIAGEQAGDGRFAGGAAVIDDIPPCDAHHRFQAEPQAVEVAGDDGLDGLAAFVVVWGGDGDFAQMDGQAGLFQTAEFFIDNGRRFRFRLAVGDVQTGLRIEEMHLGAHDVDFAFARQKILDLIEIRIRHVVVVNVEFCLRGEDAFSDFEGAVGVVSRHGAVCALADAGAWNHEAFAVVRGAFVDDIPTVDFVTVTEGDFDDASGDDGVEPCREFWEAIREFIGGHLFETWSESVAGQTVVLRIAIELGVF